MLFTLPLQFAPLLFFVTAGVFWVLLYVFKLNDLNQLTYLSIFVEVLSGFEEDFFLFVWVTHTNFVQYVLYPFPCSSRHNPTECQQWAFQVAASCVLRPRRLLLSVRGPGRLPLRAVFVSSSCYFVLPFVPDQLVPAVLAQRTKGALQWRQGSLHQKSTRGT